MGKETAKMSNFTNSPLATIRNTNHNKINGSGNFTRRITKITIHHAAGVISGANLLGWGHNPKCNGSWQYGIGNDGVIGLMTEERHRAWTSSSATNDYQAVTIEVSNSATGGEWPVGAKAYAALLDLCTDICRRNGIKKLTFDGTPNGSLTHHSMFANTSCPGKFLLDRFKAICDEVNKRLGAASTPAPATPTTPTPSTLPPASTGDTIKKGDTVKIAAKATYFGGGSIPDWVKNQNWIVASVSGDRAVIDKNVAGTNSINSPINTRFLTVVGGASAPTAPTASAFQPYTVKVTAATLNIRKGAGTNHAVVGTIKDKGIYTIVEEANGSGAKRWGRLKSGVGWISLDHTVKR